MAIGCSEILGADAEHTVAAFFTSDDKIHTYVSSSFSRFMEHVPFS